MIIRVEHPKDHTEIRDLVYEAFEDNPHREPGTPPTEPEILEQLRSHKALTLSLVAEQDGQIIGHVAFSPVTINGQDLDWFGLGPVAVAYLHRTKGVGAKLIRKGLEILRNDGASGVVVLGDPDYYQKFGFKPDRRLYLADVPQEYFMMLAFEKDLPEGEVAYHPAFN
ncbi:GNAT family N-acetyltransferase [Flexibacterium corallicola]|uniref:GNAT family N-acetyltransferase n=1 Tax=Flexibacterium corallicola TaxID=3037259 RepID=UPI00286ED685|nr:N-acetyltransferase [Pseudovibrio sp. M1P-2-3]